MALWGEPNELSIQYRTVSDSTKLFASYITVTRKSQVGLS